MTDLDIRDTSSSSHPLTHLTTPYRPPHTRNVIDENPAEELEPASSATLRNVTILTTTVNSNPKAAATKSKNAKAPPEVTSNSGAGVDTRSGGGGKQGGAHPVRDNASDGTSDYGPHAEDDDEGSSTNKVGKATKTREKQKAFQTLGERARKAETLDQLAGAFKELVKLMRDYKGSNPVAANYAAMDEFAKHLEKHHIFSRDAESPTTFSALLTTTIEAPILALNTQIQAQHKAIQSLSKSVAAVKAPVLSMLGSYASAAAGAPARLQPTKPVPAPLTNTPDEHILLRCNGEMPTLFSQPYHSLVPSLNAQLALLDLPKVVAVSGSRTGDLFLVPSSKEDVITLSKEWLRWGPDTFPVDGIPHSAVTNLKLLVDELMERHPELGPVIGTPSWVNPPPTGSQISATIAAGRKPRTAGSVESTWKLITESLRVKAVESTEYLNRTSSVPIPTSVLRLPEHL
ncbi:hypothetical protein K438DRAFT_1979169 [Mycena galopus ATCC 62051]|nr:hypothetical protein K438DRAFT_1979169 [Mycena galopus ATCC 62051]